MGYDITSDHHGPLPQTLHKDGTIQGRFTVSGDRKFINDIYLISNQRAARWHSGGIQEWSALEWAGAMCGEAGEAANAAKKLKRVEDEIANHNLGERQLDTAEKAQKALIHECCDTILYALLTMARAGCTDPEEALRAVFNKKSEEYGFPERI